MSHAPGIGFASVTHLLELSPSGTAKATPAVVRTWLRIEPNGESNVLQAVSW